MNENQPSDGRREIDALTEATNRVLSDRFFLHALLGHIDDHIYFKDLEGRFLLINESMSKLFGLSHPDEAKGKTDFHFFTTEHAEQTRRDELEIIKTGIAMVGIEEKETWPDGRVTWVSTTKEVLRDHTGAIIGTFGISRNVTEQHRIQAERNRYAGQLKKINEQMHSDLAMAAEMQETLLPVEYPLFPGDAALAATRIRFAHRYQPAGTVGGDLLCIERVSPTKAGVFICDAIGHGVRSAIFSAMILSLFHELTRYHHEPETLLHKLNGRLRRLMDRCPDVVFATSCYLTLDYQTGMVECANAGHPTPVLFDHTTKRAAPIFGSDHEIGPALALHPTAIYNRSHHHMVPGDRIVLVTDGIIEAAIHNHTEEYGTDRLCRQMERHALAEPAAMLDALFKDLEDFAGKQGIDDDLCAVCLELTDHFQ